MSRGIAVAGTGRRGFFRGYEGHGENSAHKSNLMSRLEKWPSVASLLKKGHGEIEAPVTIVVTHDTHALPELAATHCTAEGVWSNQHRII